MKNILFITIAVYFLLFSLNAFSYYLQIEDRDVLLSEKFTSNNYGWYEKSNKKVEIKVQSGKYYFNHHREKGGWSSYTTIKNFNTNNDFIIEVGAKHISGIKNSSYGFQWGVKSKEKYRFSISGDGSYKYYKYDVNGKYINISQWRKSKYIDKFKSNKLAVERKGDRLYLYINGQLVNHYSFENFSGNKIGFYVGHKQAIEFDNLLVAINSKKIRVKEKKLKQNKLAKEKKQLVIKIQKQLIDQGYLTERADGIAGKNTLNAIKDFYDTYDLKFNGRIDKKILLTIKKIKKQELEIQGQLNNLANIADYHAFIDKKPNLELSNDDYEKIFELYKKENSISAYNEFINRHPNSLLVIDAEKEIKLEQFKIYQQKNTISGYDKFIEEQSNNGTLMYTFTDRLLIDVINAQFKLYKELNTIAGYHEFIQKHPDSTKIKDAIDLIIKLNKSEDRIAACDDIIQKNENNRKLVQSVLILQLSLYQKLDTISGYEEFIKKYPDSELVEDAVEAQFELYENLDTLVGYDNFIEQHPKSVFVEDAIQAQFNLYKKTNTLTAYNEFIDKYPDSKQVEDAIAAKFILHKKNNTLLGYETFIQNYPSSKFEGEILTLLYQLTAKQDAIQAYKDYIKKYPDSQHINQADDAIFKLELGKGTVKSLYMMAGKHERKKNYKKATQIYEYIIDNFPDDDLALKANDRLLNFPTLSTNQVEFGNDHVKNKTNQYVEKQTKKEIEHSAKLNFSSTEIRSMFGLKKRVGFYDISKSNILFVGAGFGNRNAPPVKMFAKNFNNVDVKVRYKIVSKTFKSGNRIDDYDIADSSGTPVVCKKTTSIFTIVIPAGGQNSIDIKSKDVCDWRKYIRMQWSGTIYTNTYHKPVIIGVKRDDW